jgi:hypothetical protein
MNNRIGFVAAVAAAVWAGIAGADVRSVRIGVQGATCAT